MQSTTTRTNDTDDIAAAIFAGAVICLAGYGLYKIVSNEYEKRYPIGHDNESDLLEQYIRKHLGE